MELSTSTSNRSHDLRVYLKILYQLKDPDSMIQTLSNHIFYCNWVEFRVGCTQDAYDTGFSPSHKMLCCEHPEGRNRSIRNLLLPACDPNVTDVEFDQLFRKECEYIVALVEENKALVEYYRNHPDASKEEAYAAVCSPIVEWVNPSKR